MLQVFFLNHLPPKSLKISLEKLFQLFLAIREDIRKSRCILGINDTAAILSPVATTPVANLPPVSTTQEVNLLPVLLLSLQIMGTISDCLHLKVNLKKKIHLYLLPKGVKQIISIFLIKDFFQLPLVSVTTLVHLELRMFKKILKYPNGILRGLGETVS